MAAGLTVSKDKVEELREFISKQLELQTETLRQQPELRVDSVIGLRAINRDLTDLTELVAPFGNGNPEPRFMLRNVRVKYADVKAEKHVAATLIDDLGNMARSIAFRCVGDALGECLLAGPEKKWNIVGRVQPDEWRGGRAAQLLIEDIAQIN